RELGALLAVIDPETGTAQFGSEEAALADYDDLDDFDGKSFSPPINTNREALHSFAAFTQQKNRYYYCHNCYDNRINHSSLNL
ncbi:unnamed protein product, partial [marine sediment metagenome]